MKGAMLTQDTVEWYNFGLVFFPNSKVLLILLQKFTHKNSIHELAQKIPYPSSTVACQFGNYTMFIMLLRDTVKRHTEHMVFTVEKVFNCR